MSANLPYDSVEKLVVQVFSMHFCIEDCQVKVQKVFQIINHFLLTLIETFEKKGSDTVETFEKKGSHISDYFPLPPHVEQITTTPSEGSVDDCSLDVDFLHKCLEEGKCVYLHFNVPVGGELGLRVVGNTARTHACVEVCGVTGDVIH